MAATDRPAIVQLDGADAAGGLALSAEAHWNQSVADWRFFLQQGIVFGVRDGEGRLIATAALLPHTTTDAWLSMVLVTERWRRRGLASRLVQRCLSAADEMKLATWLDATPAGAVVYGPLGFKPMLELRRLRYQGAAREGSAPAASDDFADFIARDRASIGFDRSKLLKELSSRSGSRMPSNGGAVALVRDGRTARHIGPLFARSLEPALALVDGIAALEAGDLLMDAVASHERFLAGLVEHGWKIERPFQRMRFGGEGTRTVEPPFAVAGPEYG
jgi:GNAT superfamily N-acetyltransferase